MFRLKGHQVPSNSFGHESSEICVEIQPSELHPGHTGMPPTVITGMPPTGLPP